MNIEQFAALDRYTQKNMISDAEDVLEVLREIKNSKKTCWYLDRFTKVTYDGHGITIIMPLGGTRENVEVVITPSFFSTLINLLELIQAERIKMIESNECPPVVLLPLGSIDRERFRRMSKEEQKTIIDEIDRSIAKMKENSRYVKIGEPYLVGHHARAIVDSSLNLTIKSEAGEIFIYCEGILRLLEILRLVDGDFEKTAESMSGAYWQKYLQEE